MTDELNMMNTTLDEIMTVAAGKQDESSIPLQTEQQRLEQFFVGTGVASAFLKFVFSLEVDLPRPQVQSSPFSLF